MNEYIIYLSFLSFVSVLQDSHFLKYFAATQFCTLGHFGLQLSLLFMQHQKQGNKKF